MCVCVCACARACVRACVQVLEAVLVGLVGVVGNGMQKVAVSTADHVKLVQNLAYLLVEAAGKV